MAKNIYPTSIETTAPTSETAGVIGQWYLDTTANKLYQYRSSGWEEVAAGGGSGGSPMYQHNITWIVGGQAQKLSFSFINDVATPYTSSKPVGALLREMGFTDYQHMLVASGIYTFGTSTTGAPSVPYMIIGVFGYALSGGGYNIGYTYNTDNGYSTNSRTVDDPITDIVIQIGSGSASASAEERHMHNVMANATTQSGTWRYQFELENSQAEPYTQIGQVGHYLYQLGNGVRIPASGMCTLGNDKYIITAITAASTDNMVKFEMYNILTGEFKDDMTTGAVEVTDVVS